jgi:hypothetical protein
VQSAGLASVRVKLLQVAELAFSALDLASYTWWVGSGVGHGMP